MGGTVGSVVTKCADDGVGAPVAKTSHKDCAIKILSIKEKGNDVGPEFKDSQAGIHVKSLNDQLLIKYRVTACSMQVTLWVEFDRGNQIHSRFYTPYDGHGISVPRVAVVVSGESKNPGIYEALWDGRDQTGDHRILLDARYKVRIQGLHEVTLKDETTIRIVPPFARNFGIHYPNNTTRKEILKAKAAQQKLVDGTSFNAEAGMAQVATVAWERLRVAAVGVVSGHSNPKLLSFYPEESQPGQPFTYSKKKASYIVTLQARHPEEARKKIDFDHSVMLPDEPPDALRDVFLIVLAGCRASNEVLLMQEGLKALSKAYDPGRIDGRHGPKTTAALRSWQEREGVEPADGTKNGATLAKLGIDPGLDEGHQTREVQTRLKTVSKNYDPGLEDGQWGDVTEAAVTRYQEDHSPPLDVTSLPDEATFKHLHPRGSLEGEAHNIAEAFVSRGANIAFGFEKKVSFDGAEKWHIAFWDQLAQGAGIDDAASQARAMAGARHFKELGYKLYTREGVDKNSTLHPARHGRDLG